MDHDIDGTVVTSLHGHLSSQLGVPVAVGDRVSRGDVIGYIAADEEDGGPWSPHLHFGIRRGRADLEETLCGEWLYVGYTRDCATTPHEEARDFWYDPTTFLVERGAELSPQDPVSRAAAAGPSRARRPRR
jgi:murein DD-endopeptidase MepM/ murein hydrolase activator NlpD